MMMKRTQLFNLLFICGLLVLMATENLLLFNQVQHEFTLKIDGKDVTVSFQTSDQKGFMIINTHGHSVNIDLESLKNQFDIYKQIKDATWVIEDSPDIVLNNLTQPVILDNCSRATIWNSYIASYTDTILTVLQLDNCPDSIIKNVTISNITTTDSFVSGITLINSDNTSITNTSLRSIAGTSNTLFSTKEAYGIMINSSSNVTMTDLIIENISSTNGMATGIYGLNSDYISINNSNLLDISSKSSFGVKLENCQFSSTYLNNLTNIDSDSRDTAGISIAHSNSANISFNRIFFIDGTARVSGIRILESDGTNAVSNNISSLTTQSYLHNSIGLDINGSSNAELTNNSISDIQSSSSEAKGISIQKCQSSDFFNNTISSISASSQSAFGIHLDSSVSISVSQNNISEVSSDADTYSIPTSTIGISGYGIYAHSSNLSIFTQNRINNTVVWISTDETCHDTTHNANFVDSLQSGLENFIQPIDQTLQEDETSFIRWDISDSNPANYTVYLNDHYYLNTTEWSLTTNFIVDVSLESLPVGSSKYLIVFQEDNGIVITDEVIVNVYETTNPNITSRPEPIYYQIGSPQDYHLNWTINDTHPMLYYVYRNGTEIAYGDSNTSTLLSLSVGVGGLSLYNNDTTIYNMTLLVEDSSGNKVTDTVFVWVLQVQEIIIQRNTGDFIEYDVNTITRLLNWSIVSIEGGNYRINRQDSIETVMVTSATFNTGDTITHPLENLEIGTYTFTLLIEDNLGNSAEDSVIVKVLSNPRTSGSETTQEALTAPPYTMPIYLVTPEGEFPWLLVIGGLGGIGLSVVAFFVLTKRIFLPTAIKDGQKALKHTRKIKDKSEEAKQLSSLSQVLLETGDYNGSIIKSQEALNLFKKLDDKQGQLIALETLGVAYLKKGVERSDI